MQPATTLRNKKFRIGGLVVIHRRRKRNKQRRGADSGDFSHWLPEAHTDFLMAVIGEEFGLIGVLVIIGLFLWMIRRIMHIGRQSIALDRLFSGLVAQGVGIWVGFQTFINIGVNLGALPTKGLTLPLMSYGGSAIVMNLIALAVVLRIDYENRVLMRGGRV